jgi:hypothetical protein
VIWLMVLLGCSASVSKESGWSSVSAGGIHTCAVGPDGLVACWGCGYTADVTKTNVSDVGQCAVPTGLLADSVAAGWDQSCALDLDGELTCWPESSDTPTGSFASVGVGEGIGCVLDDVGEVTCWGDLKKKPVGAFEHLSVGRFHACGLADGEIICWGDNEDGQSEPPDVQLTTLDAGESGTCGLTPLGEPICWGESPTTPDNPAGDWNVVSVGGSHACLVGTDSSVLCFGDNTEGQSTAPEAEFFEEVSAGSNHTCGVREDGHTKCWGDDARKQATPL